MSILDNAKDIAKAVHEINNLELYQRVLDLHSDIIGIVENSLHLRSENKELKATLDIRAKMTFKQPFYYQVGDTTPYCSACWESNTKAIHVVLSFDNGETARWDCPACKHMYLVEGDPAKKVAALFSESSGPGSWMER